jgi:hypothetical protein
MLTSPGKLDLDLAFQAEIYDAAGHLDEPAFAVSWDGHYEAFVVHLPPGELAPGAHRIHLYGVRSGARKPLADYDFTVSDG